MPLIFFFVVPGKNEIIMYGGTWGGVACNDYAYTFDTNLMKWKAIVFPQLNDNSCSAPNANCGGPRFGHSAILVKDVLYIMFGADGSRSLQNNVVMLNITSMMWLGADANSTYSAQAANGNGTSSDTSSTGLSGGKIAGVVVGVVAGVRMKHQEVTLTQLVFVVFSFLCRLLCWVLPLSSFSVETAEKKCLKPLLCSTPIMLPV
ncbi:hypothetical protein DM01DRAFT_1169815 [Hesseltinella vesiculosa]|uniref:Galactose oxidase n=1 Tax=Hesseltinella vesiculosa TaxID=101127 RepID=A0A1X2G5M6_9FUNG|nr:hypothetical protein DM01DRAFT_1169815 [Hesseltinella vesiculosa]